MSILTGKCDLYDHVYMIGSKGTTDNMTKKEMFEVFKQRTNVIFIIKSVLILLSLLSLYCLFY